MTMVPLMPHICQYDDGYDVANEQGSDLLLNIVSHVEALNLLSYFSHDIALLLDLTCYNVTKGDPVI